MNQKKLKKTIVGHNLFSNSILTIQLLFELSAQVLVIYLLGKLVTNSITPAGAAPVFIGIIGSFILKAVFNYVCVTITHKKAYSALTVLRLKIVEQLKQLPFGFFKEHSTGELTGIIENDVEKIEVYLAHGLPQIMSALLIPLFIFIFMLFIQWQLALIMLTGIPFMVLTKILSSKKMEKTFEIYCEHENTMREQMMDYTKNIAVVKAFAKEETISEKTLQTAEEYIYWVKKSMNGITVPMGLIDVFMEIGTVCVMILGSILLVHQEITIPQYILSIVLSSMFIMQISKTATLHHFSIVFNEAVKNIGTVMNEKPAAYTKEAELSAGDIQCEQVGFKYTDDRFALKNINLHIKNKSLTAFVGSSGCGKSTLANLIMGFWKPESGSITIAEKNIAAYSPDTISSLIGTVSQETILFNLSIFENIALGKTDASKNDVIEASKKAGCHDFISQLPNGYDTKVGEMGAKLSGGEKQRISIARMLLKDAPIIILDEALSALDSKNEKLITDMLEHIRKDKTVISIAHHLNTITQADQIVVIDKGEIVRCGTHTELLQSCSLYSDMVAAQNKVDTWNIR